MTKPLRASSNPTAPYGGNSSWPPSLGYARFRRDSPEFAHFVSLAVLLNCALSRNVEPHPSHTHIVVCINRKRCPERPGSWQHSQFGWMKWLAYVQVFSHKCYNCRVSYCVHWHQLVFSMPCTGVPILKIPLFETIKGGGLEFNYLDHTRYVL